jgi:hypothetical protein
MSLSAKVTAAVNKSFTAAGDLVKQGTLSSKTVSGYDFATKSTVSTTETLSVDVIIQSTQKPSGEGFTVTAIMKSGINISVYDTLTVNSKSYNIIDYSDNGFVIEAILIKET